MLAWALAAVLAGAVAGLVIAAWPGSRANAKPVWFDLALPDSVAPRSAFGASIALSPDGSVVAYIGSSTQSLFVRRLDDPLPRRLVGTEGAQCPSFSPDGQWIVFTARRRASGIGLLKKVAVHGALPIVVADSVGTCGVWTDRDEILFELRGQLFRVSPHGGSVSLVARPDSTKRIGFMIPSQALPGGDGALITLTETLVLDWQIGFVSLSDGHVTKLARESAGPRYAAGYLIFNRHNHVFAAPFSLRTLQFTGPAVTLLRDTITDFATAENRSLAYIAQRQATLSLVAVGADGQTRTLGGHPERARGQVESVIPLDTAFYYGWPRLSPDGKRVALEMRTGPFAWDIWVYDIASRALSRLTSNFTGIRPAGWTPDSRNVVYIALDSARLDGPKRLVAQPWDGSAPPRDLMRLPANTHDVAVGPRHRYAVFSQEHAHRPDDTWIAPLDTPHAMRLVVERGRQPQLSPDETLLAYSSTETGRSEVHIQTLAEPVRRVQVSTGGGYQPVWSPDGQHLYYRFAEWVMRATIARDPELRVTRRDTLFRDVFEKHNVQNYDVFPRGEELLMIRQNPPGPAHAAVVLNWAELLRRRAAIR